jgi:hypothetical protein
MKKRIVVASMLFSVCTGSYAQMTPEQMQQIMMLQQVLQMKGGSGGMPNFGGMSQQQMPALQPSIVITEEALAKKVMELGSSMGSIAVEKYRDGFSIDKIRFVDAEGGIIKYAYDALTGDVTYLVKIMPGQYKIKTMRARTGVEPLTLATATYNMGTWQVNTVTGKALSGSSIIPLSRGILVVRDNVAFRYIPGKGVSNVVGPENFSFASFQNGDIEGTGYALMERNQDISSQDSAGQFMSSLKALGSLVGVNKKADYMLLDINTGAETPINVSLEGKDVQILSQCKQKKIYLNICEKMDSFDSLYDPKTNTPNLTHYYWRISWYKTVEGPILISQEGGLSEINATNLKTGKKSSLFHRSMGIAGYSTKQSADGKVSVNAQLGFGKENIDDVIDFMANAPEKKNKASEAQESAQGPSGNENSIFGL